MEKTADANVRAAKVLKALDGPWRLNEHYPMLVGYAVALERGRDVKFRKKYPEYADHPLGLLLGRKHELPMEFLRALEQVPQVIEDLIQENHNLKLELSDLETRDRGELRNIGDIG